VATNSAPPLEPLRPRGLQLTHVSLVPQGGDTGLYLVNRHFLTREKYPRQESWEDRPLGEALALVKAILAMEGRW
jgi:hypothetical protein